MKGKLKAKRFSIARMRECAAAETMVFRTGLARKEVLVMITISGFGVEHAEHGCVTDNPHPRFSYAVQSDKPGVEISQARLTVGEWTGDASDQTSTVYAGAALKPFREYRASLDVRTRDGEHAHAEVAFETGRLNQVWQGRWISDADYDFTEKKVSPVPMVFRKSFACDGVKTIRKARLYATAMGVYEFSCDGKKVGDTYFAPGFTSYKTNLQYQTYDVTDMISDGISHTLLATVAGGWAVGSFVFTRKNRVSADRQALLAELRIEYTDGSVDIIGTDDSWEVSESGPVRMADLYDGETYDATMETGADGTRCPDWHNATLEKPRCQPKRIEADYGSGVVAHETLSPVSVTKREDGELVYDFGQNFAGVVRMRIANGKTGQTIVVRHAEILNRDGSLNTAFLRTAKATATYKCADAANFPQDVQEYSPRFTYMGFRYVGVKGISADDLQIEAVVLHSKLRRIGDFECSDERLNQLQHNIVWGAKSNFVDIPTDCPQRDERMGWTGDIAVFSPTACLNFDMTRFLEKWLKDVKAEQLKTGGIPNTVPVQGYGFPATMPKMAVDWWGDACVLVPWAVYRASGDDTVLRDMYDTMKRYVKACTFWAGLLSFGKSRYIWNTPSVLHFGDWIAPDVPKMSQWQGRAKWTATASLNNTSRTLAHVAQILGNAQDTQYYNDLADKVADAYCSILTDGNGKLANEFQTGYVLPLYLNMFPRSVRGKAVDNLVKLIESNDYRIGTGFPGTPYILFALADNGREDVAYRMLLNTQCPSWLYEVKMGATTIWERWDGLDENGECPIGDDGTDMMISYNHYASGAVGAFLYQRVAGIEAVDAAYRRFKVKPVVGGGLTWAKAHVDTPYGRVGSAWSLDGTHFSITVEVPVGTTCELTLPDGTTTTLRNGVHTVACETNA